MQCLTRQSGVSMLEIMLVIVIIAISGAIAFPRMEAAALRPKLESAANSLGTIADAIRLCQTDSTEGVGVTGERAKCLNQPNLNDTITRLETLGYLKRASLADNFCYSWDNSGGDTYLASERNWKKKIRAELTVKGADGNLICPAAPTDLDKTVTYLFASDMVSGRPGDQKMIPVSSGVTKMRSTDPDNF